MIRAFKDKSPIIASQAFIDESAQIIGDVSIDKHSSIWPLCVVRGDVNVITIGHSTNIQDGSILHVTHASQKTHPDGYPLTIGNHVTVGHRTILHGCNIHDYCLIGMGSIVMDNVTIEKHSLIGAGSLIPPGKVLETGYLWLGNPIRQIRPLSSEEIEYIHYASLNYVGLAKDTY